MEFLCQTNIFHTKFKQMKNIKKLKKIKQNSQNSRYIQCMYCWSIRETVQKPNRYVAQCVCFNPICTRKGRHAFWHDPRNPLRTGMQYTLKTCQHCLTNRVVGKVKGKVKFKKSRCFNQECIDYNKFHSEWKLNTSNQISILS
jgi:hypothetical protein